MTLPYKNKKLGRENQLSSKTKCGMRQMITIMCHICVKELLDSNFNEIVIEKISFLREMAPTFAYSKNCNFKSIIGND